MHCLNKYGIVYEILIKLLLLIMEDMNNYDEFGNYIGPDIESDEEENVIIEEENSNE